jgi:glycosyltransferase involved in cell wall biosynthesis
MIKKKIKILHITNNLPNVHNEFGGAEKACQNIAELLSKKANNVIVTTKFDKKPTLKGIKVIEIKTLTDYLPGKIGKFFKEFKLQLAPFDFLVMRQIKKILRKEKPDVIHLHNFYVFSFGVISLAKKLNIKVVFSIYDYWLFCPVGMFWKNDNTICPKASVGQCAGCVSGYRFGGNFLVKIFLIPFFTWRKIIFKHYLVKIDKFVCLSASSENILLTNGIEKERIELIYLPIDKKKLLYNDKVKKINNTILYVGWIQPRKGLLRIIEALSKVDKKLKLSLKVIGKEYDKKYIDLIKNKIKKNQLNVRFFISPSDDVFKNVFSSCEIVTIAEQWPNMSPLFLLESLTCGKTIFASNIGGIGGFINQGENGFLFDPWSSNDLKNKIEYYFKNKNKLAAKISKNASFFAQKNFHPRVVEEKYLNLYYNLS